MIKSAWFWDLIAKRYDRQVREDEGYVRAVKRFAKYLSHDDTVLDYACGTGVIAFKIANAVKHVHAIDGSAGMIQLAKERAGEREVANVHFAQQTLFDDGLEIETYDVILAFNILHLLEDPRKALERICELLKAGGLLISSTPCLGETGIALRTLLPLVSKIGLLAYLRKFRTAELRELLRDTGFDTLQSQVLKRTIPIFYVVGQKQVVAA